MSWLISLGIALGGAAAKALLEEWLGKGVANSILGEAVGFGKDRLAKSTEQTTVETVLRQVARKLKPWLEHQIPNRDDRKRISIAVAHAVQGLEAKTLVEHNLDPTGLARALAESHSQEVNLFSADEIALYRRVLDEVCKALVKVAPALRGFGTATWAETLQQQDRLEQLILQLLAREEPVTDEATLVELLQKASTSDGALRVVPEPRRFSDAEWAAAEERYRELALESCDIIDLANLPEDRHVAAKQLELRRLYVPLRVRVERLHEDETAEAQLEAVEKERRAYRWGQTKEDSTSEHDLDSRLPVGERLAAARRLVVLGDPGAGKSTLLRWIATAYLLRLKNDPDWELLPDVQTLPDEFWLPIYIRCRELTERELRGALDDFLCCTLRKAEMTDEEATCFRDFLPEKLRRGEALVLIDGLDEIQDPGLRAQFARQIEQIAVAYERAPIIATSRIVGYREMRLRIGRGFEHLIITDMEWEEKDDFARRWCLLTERPERLEIATHELINDIHSSDRIERLTGNPMLLTTLALVKRKVGRLPSRRVELYEEAVKVLLNWRSDVDEPLDAREALPQLEYLAYTMCARGEQQIHQEEALALLEEMRDAYPNVRPVRNHTPEEFLHLLEARTGLLVEAGHTRHNGQLIPVYEFRHLTFQEYLAGLALVQGKYPGFERGRTLAEAIGPLAGQVAEVEIEPEGKEWAVVENWREALRLCVAACNDEDVDDTLLAILYPGPNEKAEITARPRAVMAILCLADEPNLSETTAQEVLQVFCTQVDEQDGNSPARTSLETAALAVAASAWSEALQMALVEEFYQRPPMLVQPGGLCAVMLSNSLLENTHQSWLEKQFPVLVAGGRPAIHSALGIMEIAFERKGHVVPDIAAALINLLFADAPSARAAAWALAWLNNEGLEEKAWRPTKPEIQRLCTFVSMPQADLAAIRLLSWIFGRTGDVQAAIPLITWLDAPAAVVRQDVAAALGHLGNLEAVEPLIARLNEPENNVRRTIVKALGQLGDSRAIEPLITRLDDHEATVQEAAKDALVKIGPSSVELLLAHLDDSESDIRLAAIEVLGRLGDTRAVKSLIALLDDPEVIVRLAVAEALEKLGDTRAVEPLIAQLDDPETVVRQAIVEVLEQLGDVRAVEPLIAQLNDPEVAVRWATVIALGQLGDVRASEALIALLNDPEAKVRRAVASVLGYLGDARAVETLITRLDDPETSVRQNVVKALGQLCDPRVIEALIERLNDPAARVRCAIVDVLGQFRDVRVVKPLLARLNDPEVAVQRAIIDVLGQLGDVRAVEPLLTQLDVPAADVRRAVVKALGQLGDARAAEPLLALLNTSSFDIRSAVRNALVQIGPAAVAPSLMRLGDPKAARSSIVNILGQIGDTQAVEPLLALLNDPEVAVREAVATALGQLHDTRAVEPLLERLDDPDSAVRWAVAAALGHLSDARVVESLLTRLDDSEVIVRRIVAWSLGQLGDTRAVDPLLARLDDTEVSVRQNVVWALGQLNDERAVEPLLTRLNNSEVTVRQNVAWALGQLGDVRAVEPLLLCLNDSDVAMRQAVAQALGQLGDARAVEPLLAWLSNPETTMRRNVAWALGRLGDKRAVEPLLAQLNDRAAVVRQNVVWALGQLGETRAVEPLLARLDDSEATVRQAVAEALGQLGDTRAVEPLLAWLNDSEAAMRQNVTWALGKLGDVRAVEPFIAQLDDSETAVRQNITWALGYFGDIRAVEPLLAKMDDPQGVVRQNVVWALGQLGDARAVEPLLIRLKDPETAVRKNIAEALGQLGDPRAVESLLAQLDDPEAVVRWNVAEALGKLGELQAVEPLLMRLNDPEVIVQRKAIEALGQLSDTRAAEPLIILLNDPKPFTRVLAIRILGQLGDTRAVEPLIKQLDDPKIVIRRAAAMALGQLGDAQEMTQRLMDLEIEVRCALVEGWAERCTDSVDQELLSRDLDNDNPYIDFCDTIAEDRVQEAASQLKLSTDEIRRRYEVLAQLFPLKLAWQTPASDPQVGS